MADLAYIFHWQPSELDALAPDDLLAWHGRAIDLLKASQPKGSGHG